MCQNHNLRDALESSSHPDKTMAREVCDACQESGIVHELTNCLIATPGTGEVECDACSGRGEDDDGNKCTHCDGDGKVRCPKCGGTGYLD